MRYKHLVVVHTGERDLVVDRCNSAERARMSAVDARRRFPRAVMVTAQTQAGVLLLGLRRRNAR
jgi:hypothetical protein